MIRLRHLAFITLTLALAGAASAQSPELLEPLRAPSCDGAEDCAEACATDDAEACYQLARHLEALRVSDRAAELMRSTCLEMHHGPACLQAGELGVFDLEDDDVFEDALREACMRGGPSACGRLAEVTSDDEERAALRKREARILTTRCDDGEPWACNTLRAHAEEADVYRDALIARYRAAATQGFEAACGDEDLAACFALAEAYSAGDMPLGPTGSEVRAAELGDRALDLAEARCAAGSAHACFTTFTLMDSGYGDGEGDFDAVLARACALGHAQACADLGEEAEITTRVLEKECALDVATSCLELARYADGLNGTERAAPLYIQACQVGSVEACATIADHLAEDHPDKARLLFWRGCELGSGDACLEAGELAFEARDAEATIDAFHRGCHSANSADACDALVELFGDDPEARGLIDFADGESETRRFVPTDTARATAARERACALDATRCD